MLKEAALLSALKSTFECETWSSGVFSVGCRESVPSFTLSYTFGMRDDLDGLDCSSATRSRDAKCSTCGDAARGTVRHRVSLLLAIQQTTL